MQATRTTLSLLGIICSLFVMSNNAYTQQDSGPITKEALLKVLQGLHVEDLGFLIQQVRKRGVDFPLTNEKEFRDAGKHLNSKGLDNLIAVIRENYHVIKPTPKLDQPTFTQKADEVHFSLGERGIMYTWSLSRMEHGERQAIGRVFGSEQPALAVAYIESGKPYIDTQLLWQANSPPIQIKHNEIINMPAGWDLNSNLNALEIVNERGNAIFQLYYKSPSHLVVNAIFYVAGHPSEVFIADEDGLQGVSLPAPGQEYSLKRIFKYPSWKFPGQYEDGQTIPPQAPTRKPPDSMSSSPHNANDD
jgi:hypothetical protein